jgi:hypothetical protein
LSAEGGEKNSWHPTELSDPKRGDYDGVGYGDDLGCPNKSTFMFNYDEITFHNGREVASGFAGQ